MGGGEIFVAGKDAKVIKFCQDVLLGLLGFEHSLVTGGAVWEAWAGGGGRADGGGDYGDVVYVENDVETLGSPMANKGAKEGCEAVAGSFGSEDWNAEAVVVAFE